MKISIIIPTLNEGKYLSILLESIRKQTFKNYEIIVADALSKDNTVEIAKKYKAKIVKGGMPAVGRNKGAKAANGDFLFFLDADVKLPKNFLKKAYNEMQKRNLNLATCEMKPISGLLIDKVIHDSVNLIMKLSQYSNPHASGSCLFVSKKLFEKIGGFNEDLKLAEDHEFLKRATKIKPLRVLNSTNVMVSIRRLEKEGRFNLGKKYLRVEYHRMFKGELKEDVIKYEFGNYDKKKNKKLEKSLQRLEDQLVKIDKNYKKLSKSLKKEELTESYRRNLAKLKNQFNKAKQSFTKSIN